MTQPKQRFHGNRTVSANTTGQDYVVGDLHGQLDLLFETLFTIGFRPDCDRLFCVGDLIDRGPRSLGCLELLADPWFFAVLGNHEDMMLDALVNQDASTYLHWIENCGGEWVRDVDGGYLSRLIKNHCLTLPLTISVPCGRGTVGLIHAAVTSGQWGVFDHDSDIWNRRIARDRHDPDASLPTEAQVDGIDAVVVGHNVTPAPFVRGNTLSLDTGAASGNPPTVWPLEAVLDVVSQHLTTDKAQTFYGSLHREPLGHSLNCF